MEMSAVRPRSARLARPLSAVACLSTPVLLGAIVSPQLSGPGLYAHDGHLPTIVTHLIGGSIMLLAGERSWSEGSQELSGCLTALSSAPTAIAEDCAGLPLQARLFLSGRKRSG